MAQQPPVSGLSEDIVRVHSGLLAGTTGSDPAVRVFKGIPFAAPPVGPRRWQPPQPLAPWAGVRRADAFGPVCPQYLTAPGSFYQVEFYQQEEPHNEDCLYLNVWTTARAATEKRPVMVWFHGGRMVEGSGSLPSFHGEMLAQKGVVLVTVNYRLGLFGFLAHPELTAESPQHSSGNYGLLDQRAALQWVQRNIAAFGGDPQNVTIFGQSAGSRSVFMQLISPLSRGLMRRAIGQSGSGMASFTPYANLAGQEQTGLRLAELRGVKTLAGLRALSVAALLGDDPRLYLDLTFGPCVDGWVISDAPDKLLARGAAHDVSLMVGATAQEFTPMGESLRADAAAFRAQMAQRFSSDTARALSLYPVETDAQARQAQLALRADGMLAGMSTWASLHNAHSAHKSYLYYFSRRLPGRNSAYYGAFHSGDLYYVFGTLSSTERPWEAADHRLAEVMTSYWTNFAKQGDPNGPGLPPWPVYDAATDMAVELGEQVGAIPAPHAAQLALLREETMRSLA